MSVLYLLSDTIHFPGEVLFHGCFESQFTIRRSVGISALLQELEKVKYPEKPDTDKPAELEPEVHLVVLSLPTEVISATIQQIKTVLPTAVCIAMAEARETKENHLYEWDCLFLEKPLNEFQARCTIVNAVKQGYLLKQISQATLIENTSGLYTQRYFMGRLNKELSQAKRHKDKLSCIIFGIRYYDMFLDCYGYQFMEKLFPYLSTVLRQHIRQEDILARLGDDEIALLLPRSGIDGAKILASRIIRDVTIKPFDFMSETETIELYAGIYGFEDVQAEDADAVALDADQMIRYAHHALHHAKKQEENQACTFNELYPLS
ncbi:MAG: GGDEF domain-containing protein [Vampirovibrionales bacterium]|nr:GGDEF domain-containing protein [Vampirovibrionales bacterium]